MTREELRDYVEEQRSLNMIPYHVYSTLIDGIDTLEQEPTTKNNLGVDCISRDDVWSVMQPLLGTSGELIDRLMALPSVTPIRPEGHWKTDRQGDMQCSRCGYQRPYFIDYTSEGCKVRGELTPFCPNCGADMREVEE